MTINKLQNKLPSFIGNINTINHQSDNEAFFVYYISENQNATNEDLLQLLKMADEDEGNHYNFLIQKGPHY